MYLGLKVHFLDGEFDSQAFAVEVRSLNGCAEGDGYLQGLWGICLKP